MIKKNTGGYAFARATTWQSPTNMSPRQNGMTLRAYIATKCCAAMVSTIRNDGDYDRLRNIAMSHDLDTVSEFFAQEAVKQADALIAALEK